VTNPSAAQDNAGMGTSADPEVARLLRRVERERTARLEAERIAEEATRLSVQDPLTGLANRTFLTASLETEIARAKRTQHQIGLFFVDLDRFKLINDTYGHKCGDDLLVAVANTLRFHTRDGDLVGRLGGDEFLVIAPNITEPAAVRLAARITDAIEAIALPMLQGADIQASIGLAMLDPDTELSIDDCIRRADTAMYAAKRADADHRLFDPDLDEITRRNRTLRKEFPAAIANRTFVLHHQPIIQLDTQQFSAMEALARWPAPDGYLRPPGCFIPVAEESGHIIALGRLVAELAFDDLVRWRSRYTHAAHTRISINASPRELGRVDYASRIEATLASRDLSPHDLIVEVTESTIREAGRIAEQNLRSLRHLGAKIALDDFGTGYSSIGRLRAHAFDILKIDRTFISGVAEKADDRAVVKAILALAEVFDVEVTAEGVETPEQLEVVTELGCHAAQGWLFARAKPINDVGSPTQFC